MSTSARSAEGPRRARSSRTSSGLSSWPATAPGGPSSRPPSRARTRPTTNAPRPSVLVPPPARQQPRPPAQPRPGRRPSAWLPPEGRAEPEPLPGDGPPGRAPGHHEVELVTWLGGHRFRRTPAGGTNQRAPPGMTERPSTSRTRASPTCTPSSTTTPAWPTSRSVRFCDHHRIHAASALPAALTPSAVPVLSERAGAFGDQRPGDQSGSWRASGPVTSALVRPPPGRTVIRLEPASSRRTTASRRSSGDQSAYASPATSRRGSRLPPTRCT